MISVLVSLEMSVDGVRTGGSGGAVAMAAVCGSGRFVAVTI